MFSHVNSRFQCYTITRKMHYLPQTLRHPLLQPTLASKSINAATTFRSDWHKVGEVHSIYIYPILAGNGIYIPKCNFTEKTMMGTVDKSAYRNRYDA